MPAETNHVIGHEGARLAKRYLESTTHMNLPTTVYDNEGLCALERLDGKVKRYDLMGHFRSGAHRPLAVESKKVTGAGTQAGEYTEFLANAYSITARRVNVMGADDHREFMWVTWHPFALTRWSRLRDRQAIRQALKKHPEVLAGYPVDDAIVELLADRLWLVPLHDRIEELLLERDELYKVLSQLDRRD